MHAVPIRDEWVADTAQRVVIGPPDGDLTNPDIASLEVVAVDDPLGFVTLTSIWVLDDEERAAIAAGGGIMLTVSAPHPVTSIAVFPPGALA
jgi:hypothetical protein